MGRRLPAGWAGVVALCVVLALAVACGGGPDPTATFAPPTNTPRPPTITPTPGPTEVVLPTPTTSLPTPAPTPTPTSTLPPTAIPTVTTEVLAPTPTPAATPIPQSSGLSLAVSSPQDNTVFTAPEVVIQGAVSPDATVSVNGLLASVDPSGSFQTDVPLALAEGHNLIQIVASDLEGNVISQVLTLIYLP